MSEVIGSSVDNELVQRALARDGDAFRIIMQKYSRRIYRIARGIVRNECEAEDVVQEVFMSAFIHLGSFRGDFQPADVAGSNWHKQSAGEA